MFNWISTVLPWVISAVKYVEKAFGAKRGEEKLAAVMDLILGAVDIPSGGPARQEAVQAIQTIVNGVVALLNATGVFKKSA